MRPGRKRGWAWESSATSPGAAGAGLRSLRIQIGDGDEGRLRFLGKKEKTKKSMFVLVNWAFWAVVKKATHRDRGLRLSFFYLFYNLAKHFKEIVFHVSITEDNLYMNVKGTRIVFTVIDVCVDIVSNGKRWTYMEKLIFIEIRLCSQGINQPPKRSSYRKPFDWYV